MHFGLLALYAGPDQVMTVTSGIAGAIGVLLMFWNRVTAAFVRVVHKFRDSSAAPITTAVPNDNQNSQD